MRRFTSKNHVHENFDVIGIQRRFTASFCDKMLLRNCPAFSSKEKIRGYSVYSYSRIVSIESAPNVARFTSVMFAANAVGVQVVSILGRQNTRSRAQLRGHAMRKRPYPLLASRAHFCVPFHLSLLLEAARSRANGKSGIERLKRIAEVPKSTKPVL